MHNGRPAREIAERIDHLAQPESDWISRLSSSQVQASRFPSLSSSMSLPDGHSMALRWPISLAADGRF